MIYKVFNFVKGRYFLLSEVHYLGEGVPNYKVCYLGVPRLELYLI